MLFARRNQAYVNDEEQAKKIVFDRTIKWVNKLYPSENKEVKSLPVKISSQLQYGYDSLFQSFKSDIEQVLDASLNNDTTTQKIYEITRKYNQLSSYLKNIISMNQITPEDEERIKKDFDGIKDKLTALKNLAIANKLGNVKDIVEMVDAINKTTPTPKSQYDMLKATSSEIVSSIEDKSTMRQKLNYIEKYLSTLQNDLQTLTKAQNNAISLDKSLEQSIIDMNAQKVIDYKDLQKTINEPATQTIINKIHDDMKNIEDKLYSDKSKKRATTLTDMIDEIAKYTADIPQKITDVETDILAADMAAIDLIVDPFISQEQKQYESNLNGDLAVAEAAFKTADNDLKNLNAPVKVKKAKLPALPVEPKKPKKLIDKTKTKAEQIQDKQAYLQEKAKYEKEKSTYDTDKSAYDVVVRNNANIKEQYDNDVKQYNADVTTYTETYNKAQTKRDDISDYINDSQTFWDGVTLKIKKDINVYITDATNDINDYISDFKIIKANPAQDEKTVESHYDTLKNMDSGLDEIKDVLDSKFKDFLDVPTLPYQTTPSATPPMNFKDYFVQEYNKKFKTTKTKVDLVNKWNYYLSLLKGVSPSKRTIDERIKKIKS